MARGKKKEELSLEEKLERALVPVEEQPYEVPGNWCWVIFDNVACIKRGASPRPIKAYVSDGEGINWIKIGDSDSGKYINIVKEKITFEGANKSVYVKSGSLLLSNSMSFGRPYILNVDGCIHDGWLAITPLKVVDKDFLYYALLASNWYFEQVAVGTAVRNLNSKRVADLPIAIPPYQEQQRIVERIESLFAKLDEAKEKVVGVKESYLARRATILSLAFAGKLTSEWRFQNDIGNNWNKKTFSEVAIIKSNLVQPNEYQDFPHVAPDNIEKRTGVLLHYNTIAEDKVTSGKHRFYPGQILYSKIRPYLSKVVMVDFDGLCSADMYPIEAKENTKYLWYYMLSDDFLKQASSAGSRSVLPKINQKELSKLHVNIPDMDEQEEIVKILDKVLPYEQKVAEHMEAILEQIDVMKKFILLRAFRGELGTNNPEEKSAIEL